MDKFVSEPAAIVSGTAAYLLSRLLRAAPVVAYMRTARWLHGDDFTSAVRAIHAASHAWETSIDQRGRQNVVVKVRSPHGCGTMTTECASEALQLSRRHIQRLAAEGVLTGRRVGGKWQIDQVSVRAYQERAS